MNKQLSQFYWMQLFFRYIEKCIKKGKVLSVLDGSIPIENIGNKNQWVFVKHYSMPPAATKSKKAIFSFKVKVKVTRSLTLVSFERASLVKYACKI